MTDTQLLTVAITLLAIFIAMLVNNHRMSDLRTDVGTRIGDLNREFGQRFVDTNRHIDDMANLLRAEMKADRIENSARFVEMKAETNAKFAEMKAETNARFAEMKVETNKRFDETNTKLDSILTFLASMDQRIIRLEERVH